MFNFKKQVRIIMLQQQMLEQHNRFNPIHFLLLCSCQNEAYAQIAVNQDVHETNGGRFVLADEFGHRELRHTVSQTAGGSPRFGPVQDLPRALRHCYTAEAWQSSWWVFTHTHTHARTHERKIHPEWEFSAAL